MVFSYSRLIAFDSCRYKWLMKYILGIPKISDDFFSSYGAFMHDILARFYTGEGNNEALSLHYLNNYFSQVVGKPQRTSTAINYFNQGYDAVCGLKPCPHEVLGVEREVHWVLGGRNYMGYVDLILRSKDGIIIQDHKNRDLKPRSGRAKPTKTDIELSQYLRQLNLYSIPIYEMYGDYPAYLCLNCYRTGVQIRERFDMQAFEDTKQWAIAKANEIECNNDWHPTLEYFGCKYLCDVNRQCEYYRAGK